MSKRNHAVAMAGHPTVDSEPLRCMKVAYASEAAAKVEGAKFRQNAYQCPMCSAWHLSANRYGKTSRSRHDDRLRWWQ